MLSKKKLQTSRRPISNTQNQMFWFFNIRTKADQMLKDQQSILDSCSQKLQKLVDEQRHYNILVRDMRDEMKKNELWHAKMVELKHQEN